MITNILLTGHPGIGKTTMVKDLVKRFSHLALTGFYTEEIREEGRRLGFRAVALNGSSAVFVHRDFQTGAQHRVGKYGVKPEALEALVLSHLSPERKAADLIIIDEIAKMELLSMPVREGLLQALDSDCPLLGTISLKGTGFIKQVKQRDDVELFKITTENRRVLGEQIHRRLQQVLGEADS